jgi:hypothetical protein
VSPFGRRDQRRILEGAAAACAFGGVPSLTHALATGTPRSALAYAAKATRAAGAVVPPGRPELVRGAVVHSAISLASAEGLARVLPRRHSVLWGALAGLGLGLINLGIIAPRFFPLIAELDLAPQLADHVAFGALFAAVADRPPAATYPR